MRLEFGVMCLCAWSLMAAPEVVSPRVILDDGRLVQTHGNSKRFSPLNSGWEVDGASCLRPFNRVPAGKVEFQAGFRLKPGEKVKVEFLDRGKRPLVTRVFSGSGEGPVPARVVFRADGSLQYLRLTPDAGVDRAKLIAGSGMRVLVNWAFFEFERVVAPGAIWNPPVDSSLLTGNYAVEFSAWMDPKTSFSAGGVDASALYPYYPGLWYRLRFEVAGGVARVKVNGRDVQRSVPWTGFAFVNRSSAPLQLDDVKVYALENPADYPPRPIVPKGTDKALVGMNICSLWRNGHHWGWNCVDRAGGPLPVLGYYDEGLPETADWEIKYFVEHGVDFQAFCWYGDTDDGALRRPRNGYQLEDGFMNARYSHMMKYCLIWEIQNAGRPHTLDAWKRNYAPYFIEHYFKDPRYLVLDGKPVLSVFGAWNFATAKKGFGSVETTRAAFDWLREEVKRHGFKGVIFVSSHWGDGKKAAAMGFDVFLPYNYGGKANTFAFNRTCNENRLAAAKGTDIFVPPAVAVGFDNVPWGGRRVAMLSPDDFRATLLWMRDEFGPRVWKAAPWQRNFQWICTWNEYGEGTYTMPTCDARGFGYLDAVRDVFTDAPRDPSLDLVPTEAQRARITNLYPQAPWTPLRVTLSFDGDAKAQLSVVAPELEKRGWRGLFPIVSDWVGGASGRLTWDDVRELTRRGHEIAANTLSRQNLRILAETGHTNEVRRQIVGCADRIQKETGVRPRFLCLPDDEANATVREIARVAGLEPMRVPRHSLGASPNAVTREIARLRASGAPRADFFTRDVPPAREAFCACLDALEAAERRGDVSVGTYGR